MCNVFLPNEKHVERSKRTLRGPVGASLVGCVWLLLVPALRSSRGP